MALVAELARVANFEVGDMRRTIGAFPLSGEALVGSGWLACNGALVLISRWPALFAKIGHRYHPTSPGTDPGGGQFYLPSCTDGRTPVPRGGSQFTASGVRGGAKTVTLSGATEPSHAHQKHDQYLYLPGTGYGLRQDVGENRVGTINRNTDPIRLYPGGVTPHQNMPPVRVCGGWKIRAH